MGKRKRLYLVKGPKHQKTRIRESSPHRAAQQVLWSLEPADDDSEFVVIEKGPNDKSERWSGKKGDAYRVVLTVGGWLVSCERIS